MSSIPQTAENGNSVSDFATKFIKRFRIGSLLSKCNAGFLNNAKANWQRFTTVLSADIINRFMKPLTGEDRKDVFIADGSLFARPRSKKVELLARGFDRCPMKCRSGFRMPTLGWSDGLCPASSQVHAGGSGKERNSCMKVFCGFKY